MTIDAHPARAADRASAAPSRRAAGRRVRACAVLAAALAAASATAASGADIGDAWRAGGLAGAGCTPAEDLRVAVPLGETPEPLE